MDIIRIDKISLFGYHGVLPEERERGQEFLVSVALEADLEGISKTDDLNMTYNYAAAAELVKKIVTGEPVNLLETLAEMIALEILKDRMIVAVTVTVEKPRPPLTVISAGTAVTMRRSKNH